MCISRNPFAVGDFAFIPALGLEVQSSGASYYFGFVHLDPEWGRRPQKCAVIAEQPRVSGVGRVGDPMVWLRTEAVTIECRSVAPQ